jgi:hypothetical protein
VIGERNAAPCNVTELARRPGRREACALNGLKWVGSSSVAAGFDAGSGIRLCYVDGFAG